MSEASLRDLLSKDDLPEPAIADPAAQAELPVAGSEAPKPADVPVPPADATNTASAKEPDEPWTKTAYEAEKRKRQDLERQFKELQARLDETAKPKDAAPQAELDPLLDPDGFRKAIARDALISTSEAVMRSTKPDYDAVVAVYAEAFGKGEVPPIPPTHPNPAQFVYDWGKKVSLMSEIGDPTTYEQRLREKWETERATADASAKAALEAQIMPTIAGDRNAAPRESAEVWSGPAPLKDLLKKRK